VTITDTAGDGLAANTPAKIVITYRFTGQSDYLPVTDIRPGTPFSNPEAEYDFSVGRRRSIGDAELLPFEEHGESFEAAPEPGFIRSPYPLVKRAPTPDDGGSEDCTKELFTAPSGVIVEYGQRGSGADCRPNIRTDVSLSFLLLLSSVTQTATLARP
jgi:hypothetical protein